MNFLAQFYNSIRPTSVTWPPHRRYDFSALRKVYLDALSYDDDILTQFAEEGEHHKRIEQPSNFAELVETWRWMNTDRD